MTPRNFTAALLVAGLALATAGAGGTDAPKGSYSTEVQGTKFVLTLGDKGRFTVMMKDQVGVEGTYKVTKDEIEFSDEKGSIADTKSKVGRYRWKLDGQKLSFTKVEDDSKGRSAVLTAQPWVKEKDK
jgi:hypothetical protein